jgi:fluoride ion exporter CrcB/FEX
MWKSVIAVSVGAALVALLRWWLSLRLNALLPAIPPGPLAANQIGAYNPDLVGVALDNQLDRGFAIQDQLGLFRILAFGF